MIVDFDVVWADVLDVGAPTTWSEVDALLNDETERQAAVVSEALGQVGWYEGSSEPYEPPKVPFESPRSSNPPVVVSVRRLWIARFNPGTADWANSDPDDDSYFTWKSPEDALLKKHYWLSTMATPASKAAIHNLELGDLVIVQRTDPKKANPPRPDLRGRHVDDVLLGVAIVIAIDDWDDETTGCRERRACLLPAAKFDHPVPRTTARQLGRIKGGSFQKMPQNPDGTGKPGFTLSAVTPDQWSELLSVCGIHPDAMAEPDLAVLAARLRATAKGNRYFWKRRYDHVFRHSIRRQHEQSAVRRAQVWAARWGLVFHSDAQFIPNAGYDLLFVDSQGDRVQVEVKGYQASTLDKVQLQPSQAARAKSAAQGTPPDWWLFAVLKVHTKSPDEQPRHAPEVVELIDNGGIRVK